MGVLQEIIREATEKDGDVPRMLRLCLLLGKRLRHAVLTTWAQCELEGYPLSVELPKYRQFRCRNRGRFQNIAHSVTLDIPLSHLPPEFATKVQLVWMRDGVGELAHLLEVGKDPTKTPAVPWPPEATLLYLQNMAEGAHCSSAWSEISVSELAGALDQIKSKVLGFALDIELEDPTAGDVPGTDHLSLKEDKMTQIFNNNITGTVQNLANGSSDFTQKATAGVQTGDLTALLTLLRDQGLPDNELETLRAAAETDSKDGLGTKVKEWAGDLASRAVTGAAQIGLEKISTIVLPAITDYLGGN